jgi:hypothetical protein
MGAKACPGIGYAWQELRPDSDPGTIATRRNIFAELREMTTWGEHIGLRSWVRRLPSLSQHSWESEEFKQRRRFGLQRWPGTSCSSTPPLGKRGSYAPPVETPAGATYLGLAPLRGRRQHRSRRRLIAYFSLRVARRTGASPHTLARSCLQAAAVTPHVSPMIRRWRSGLPLPSTRGHHDG